MKVYLVWNGQCESNVVGRYNFVNEDINETGIKKINILRTDSRKISSFLLRHLELKV